MADSLQAIFFDIDDTLFSTTGFAEKARRASIARMVEMGLRVPEEFAYRELLEVISEFSSNYGAHYNKLLSRMPREALAGTHPSLLVAGAVIAYHETKFRELSAYEDVTEALRLIHAKTDLRLGSISSGLRIKQAEKIVRTGVWRYVDPRGIFITDEVGIGKPNPKLYWRACAARVSPRKSRKAAKRRPKCASWPASAAKRATRWSAWSFPSPAPGSLCPATQRRCAMTTRCRCCLFPISTSKATRFPKISPRSSTSR